ncbi:MAG: ATP-binding protein [bacterium]|nr:ATP-binding protein [bacterium]
MTDDDPISPQTLLRLQQRAQQTGISADDMLNRLLDEGTRLLIEAVTDIVSLHTIEGVYVYITAAVKDVLGYSTHEMLGRRGVNFFHPDDIPILKEAHHSVMTKGVSVMEYRARHKNGGYVWLETINYGMRDSFTGEIIEIVAVSREITERKQSQEALRRSEANYQLLFQEAPIAIWKQDWHEVKAYLDQLTQTGIADIEAYMRKNPRAVSDSLRLVKILDANPFALHLYKAKSVEEYQQQFYQLTDIYDSQIASLAAIAHGDTRFSGEYINYNLLGEKIYLLLKWIVMPGHTDTYDEVMVVTVDITEQKRYEESLRENDHFITRFRKEQEHHALIQRSVSALSHDLRTPLSVIATSKDLLLRYFDKLTKEKRKEKLDSIGRQLEFALELLDETVLTVTGTMNERPFHPMPINLAKLCQVSVDEVGMSYGAENRLRFVNMGQVDMVLADEILVSRILLNLLTNAVKYSPNNAEIRLELDRNKEYVVLRVVDKGVGIHADNLPHIFEPFYRVLEMKEISGTGLGLSIVKECVERHHGHIHVESQLGKGTTFTVELPALIGDTVGV